MTNEAEFVPLQGEGNEHVRGTLAEGKTLSSLVLSVVDLGTGRIDALVPRGVPAESVTDFRSPLVPEPILLQLPGRQVVEVAPPLRALAARVASLMSQMSEPVALFEDAQSRPGDAWLDTIRTSHMTYDDEIYHVVTDLTIGEETIYETMCNVSLWPFIGFVINEAGSYMRGHHQAASMQTLKSLAQRVTTIVVGAYDGDGFVVWSSSQVG
jgi:hypothetical protein